MRTIAAAMAAVSLLSVAGCATRPSSPAETGWVFKIDEALAGKTVGRGQFRAVNGVERSFVAYLNGRYEGDVFVLEEEFRYADGEQDFKTWRLTKTDSGEWRGTREDVIGEARGFQDGAAFRLEYKVKLGGRTLKFRDVLYLEQGGDVINRANVGLYGFRVARVALRITREAQP